MYVYIVVESNLPSRDSQTIAMDGRRKLRVYREITTAMFML